MFDLDELQRQASQVRSSGLLGKPGALSRLFDYLLTRSLAGEAPKEIEIAFEVFGKDSGFEVSQDSVVRVYVHKLRRRLDDYYAGLSTQSVRIAIPKGEYRLTLERSATDVAPELPAQTAPPTRGRRQLWLAAGMLALGAFIGAVLVMLLMPVDEDARLRAVRESAIWGPLLEDDLPITLVLGDYYILGQVDERNEIQRLVREFFINSADDFMRQLELTPELMKHYRNLHFTYLPTSTAFGLQEVIPVLGARKPVQIVLMSELRGSQLAGSHLIYIGFFSGMGILADPALTASRIVMGDTYDELIDTQSEARYVSTEADAGDARHVDYGFLSVFPGPGRNRVVIIAGTRDAGVKHMTEVATRPETVADIAAGAAGAEAFESLFEVYGVAGARVNGKRIFVSPLDTKRIWSMDH